MNTTYTKLIYLWEYENIIQVNKNAMYFTCHSCVSLDEISYIVPIITRKFFTEELSIFIGDQLSEAKKKIQHFGANQLFLTSYFVYADELSSSSIIVVA